MGLVPSLGAEFLGGAAGSALGQWIRGGKADLGESLVDGLGNALSGWAYGSGPIKSLGNVVFRGARAGAVYALIHHEPEKPGLGTGSWGLEGYSLKEGAAPVFSPYIKDRDIRARCMVPGAWAGSLGCQKAEGYQYGTGQAGSRSRSNGFGRLFKEVALGALLGELSSAAFYGAGKALEVLKRSVGGESGSSSINLPEYDGKTTHGVLVLDDGTQVPFSSGNANPNYKNDLGVKTWHQATQILTTLL